MGSLFLLSGRIHALVGSSLARREFPAHCNSLAGSVSVRHRGQLSSTGPDRKRARSKGPAMVWRDRWVLGWNHIDYLDRECPSVDAVALDVRIQRQDPDRGNLQA